MISVLDADKFSREKIGQGRSTRRAGRPQREDELGVKTWRRKRSGPWKYLGKRIS